jgi:copper resistance protein B
MSRHRIRRVVLAGALTLSAVTTAAWGQAQPPVAHPDTSDSGVAGMAGMQGMQGMDDMQADHPVHDTPPATTAAILPNGHVPPPAPQNIMPDMSPTAMRQVMDMHDDSVLGMFKLDELERTKADDGYGTAWSGEGWVGNDRDKLWVRSEGERDRDGTRDASLELLWDRAFAPFWDWQLGVRQDFGAGPSRQWAAFGVQGLAPYWFELQATAYVGADGRTAARVEATYELLFTQKLILTPKVELNLYGKNDPDRDIGAGVSDIETGLRLRYEINRHVAPYIGVTWKKPFANTARYERTEANSAGGVEWLAGIRIWF